MLRVYADGYVRIGARLAWHRQLLNAIERRMAITMPTEDADQEKTIFETAPEIPSDEEISDTKESLQRLEEMCRELNLVVSAELVKSAIADPPRTAREFDSLINAFVAELKSHLFLFVPGHLARYYELLLQSTITTAFPRASKEISASGNCLAAGLFTASVFHSMRAAEIGVRVLGATLGVSFPDKPIELAEWQQILSQSESKIKAMQNLQPRQHKDEELKFFSQAAVQFVYFKDAWRVRVAHARETYDENQAIRVFDHTLEFFEVLARRLKEPKPSV
jgi:hypothetical protein